MLAVVQQNHSNTHMLQVCLSIQAEQVLTHSRECCKRGRPGHEHDMALTSCSAPEAFNVSFNQLCPSLHSAGFPLQGGREGQIRRQEQLLRLQGQQLQQSQECEMQSRKRPDLSAMQSLRVRKVSSSGMHAGMVDPHVIRSHELQGASSVIIIHLQDILGSAIRLGSLRKLQAVASCAGRCVDLAT